MRKLVGNTDTTEALPTLAKWAKVATERDFERWHLIRVIWLPNEYESITFDTESFRLRVQESNAIYSELLEEVKEWDNEGTVVVLKITPGKKLSFEFIELEKEKCVWTELGEFGMKLSEVKARKTSAQKTRSSSSKPTAQSKAQEGASEG